MNNFMSDRPGFYEDLTATPAGGSSNNNGGGGGGGGGEEDSEDHNIHLRPGSSSAASAVIEREHMFDKVVTPSDVGKLNRLVIPKQHAEKYFPLDSSTNEKGLLLNFEDRNGKPWRFRYSYWNSSQSYVMTKGWSRFVKEKKLDAGDIVSFQRGVGDAAKDRLFIDWRRRPDAPDLLPPPLPHHFSSFQYRSGWNPLFLNHHAPSREYSFSSPYQHHYQQQQQQQHHHHHHHPYNNYGGGTVVNGNPCPPGSIFYLRPGGQTAGGSGIIVPGRPQLESTGGGGVDEQMVYESVPVVQGKAAAKRLRLFGVNMDCPIDADEDETTTTTTISDECDNMQQQQQQHMSNSSMPLHHYFPTSSTNTMAPSPTSSSTIHHQHHQHQQHSPNSSLRLRPYETSQGNKGKGSMSLDLDI